MGSARAPSFALYAAFILLAPGYAQLFGGFHPLLPRWMMFATIGVGVYEVRFEQHRPGSEPVLLDRLRLLGYSSPRAAPPEVRALASEADALAQAKLICERLGPSAHVRMRLRRAVVQGWEVLHDGSSNVCADFQSGGPDGFRVHPSPELRGS